MHRIFAFWLSAALFIAVGLAGCSSDPGEHFDNLVDCVNDHPDLTEPHAITHCLVDFPELHPDFPDQQSCVAWVTDNGDYAASADDACTDYFNETGG